jgi:hypothetical protein
MGKIFNFEPLVLQYLEQQPYNGNEIFCNNVWSLRNSSQRVKSRVFPAVLHT